MSNFMPINLNFRYDGYFPRENKFQKPAQDEI